MGRPPIGREKMSGAERTRRYRTKLREAVAEGHKAAPEATACAWCGRSDRMLVGDRGILICAACVTQASIEIAEAQAAKKRVAAAVDIWGADATDDLPDSSPSS